MTDESPATWLNLATFLAEEPLRQTTKPISYGGVSEPGPHSIPEEWELLWFPGTGELVEHRREADPGVRLIGRAPHRDYIDAEIADREQAEKDVRVHRRRWEVTHPDEKAGRYLGWRSQSGSSGLRARLAWWQQAMEGRFVDGLNDYDPLDDWGHTVDHVDGPLEWNREAWDELVPIAVDAVDEALKLERTLRGQYNLAEVANLASGLRTCAQLLHRALVEAYGAAHRAHPGRIAED